MIAFLGSLATRFEYNKAVAELGWFLGFHGTSLWSSSTCYKESIDDRLTPLSGQKSKKTASVAYLSML